MRVQVRHPAVVEHSYSIYQVNTVHYACGFVVDVVLVAHLTELTNVDCGCQLLR